MVACGRPEMAEDPRFSSNPGRVQHQNEIDEAIGRWSGTLPCKEVCAALDAAAVPGGPIYAVDDMFADEHYHARGMFENVVTVGGAPLKLPALCPKLEAGYGETSTAGPELGEHTRAVLERVLELPPARIDELVARGVVGAK